MTNVYVVTEDRMEWSKPIEMWTDGRKARRRAEQLRRDLLARRTANRASGKPVPLGDPLEWVETYSVRRVPLRGDDSPKGEGL